jgi:ribosomal protein L32
MTEDNPLTGECAECGNKKVPDEDGFAYCYGSPPDSPHTRVEIFRPCERCGEPIRAAELCEDCGKDIDGDAFTTNWGDGAD